MRVLGWFLLLVGLVLAWFLLSPVVALILALFALPLALLLAALALPVGLFLALLGGRPRSFGLLREVASALGASPPRPLAPPEPEEARS